MAVGPDPPPSSISGVLAAAVLDPSLPDAIARQRYHSTGRRGLHVTPGGSKVRRAPCPAPERPLAVSFPQRKFREHRNARKGTSLPFLLWLALRDDRCQDSIHGLCVWYSSRRRWDSGHAGPRSLTTRPTTTHPTCVCVFKAPRTYMVRVYASTPGAAERPRRLSPGLASAATMVQLVVTRETTRPPPTISQH